MHSRSLAHTPSSLLPTFAGPLVTMGVLVVWLPPQRAACVYAATVSLKSDGGNISASSHKIRKLQL